MLGAWSPGECCHQRESGTSIATDHDLVYPSGATKFQQNMEQSHQTPKGGTRNRLTWLVEMGEKNTMETARWKGGLDNHSQYMKNNVAWGPSSPPRPGARDREGHCCKRDTEREIPKVLQYFRWSPDWKQDEEGDAHQRRTPHYPP